MKWAHAALTWALTLGLLALGLVWIASVLNVDKPWIEFLVDNRLGRFSVGVCAVFLVLLFWLTAIPMKPEQFLTLESEGGALHVSVKAINDLLGRLAEEFQDVVRLRADVAASREGQVEAHLDLSVKAGSPVQQLAQALQQRVRESLRENLGITEVRSVTLSVNEIVAGRPAAPRPPADRSGWQDATS